MRLVQERIRVGERIERDVRRAFGAQPIAGDVERDRIEPGLQAQLASLFEIHLREGAIGTNERVLNDLFGIFPIAGHPQRKAIEAALEVVDDRFEGFGTRCRFRCAHRSRRHRRYGQSVLPEEWCERAHSVG